MVRRWFAFLVVLALVSGTVLSLPVFWGRPVVGEKTAQFAQHWLDCVFTASSALTGTGLSPHDIGEDFNLGGQVLVLVLVQAGGLGVLIAGSVVGWRFRRQFGWGRGDEDTRRAGLRVVIGFVCAMTLVLEAVGAVAMYVSTEVGPDGPPRPAFAAVFHAISAFCNNGLTLTRDSFVAQGGRWPVYAILLPLMVLGSIGGPVLHELWQRFFDARTRGVRLSRDARVTLVGTVVLVVGGAAVLFFTESTPRWQLRNPRADTPGRLMVGEKPAGEGIVFSGDSSSAARQRMRTMGAEQRAATALFHSVSARSAGFRVARLDEKSLSPAGRMAMMGLMIVGGGLGGAAGGLRITLVVVLLGTLMKRRKKAGFIADAADYSISEGGRDARPPGDARLPEEAGLLAVRAAAGVAAGMFLLIGCSALVLIYREPASAELCVFDAVSACTNSGLAIGPMRLLSPEGQVMIVLAMLLGRVIPLAMLANYFSRLVGLWASRGSLNADRGSTVRS